MGTVPFNTMVTLHLNTKAVNVVEKIRYVSNDAAWPSLVMPVDKPDHFLATILGLTVSSH